MEAEWVRGRRRRKGEVIGGKHSGADAYIDPDDRDPNAWHIFVLGGPYSASFDIWAADGTQLIEWLEDNEMPIRLNE